MLSDSQRCLTPKQLIEIEKLCDQFERDLIAGRMVEMRSLVATARPEIKVRLRHELRQILDDHTVRGNTPPQPPEVSTDQLEPRDTFGRFQLDRICGRGSTGTVWRAFDPTLGRWIALKIALPESIIDSQRFVREAQAVANLSHRNIVPVYEAGQIDQRCFLVSEFVEGQTLARMLSEGPMEPCAAVALLLQIADAVRQCHAAGIIHRDLKPANVIISTDGTARVTDFGLAKNLHQDHSLTREGTLVGTPGYMAPEQARGDAKQSDERTDVYALGAILFELLTGQVPFTGSFERTVFQIVHSPAPNARGINDGIDAELAAICSRCLEKSPERRFQSADALAEELRRFEDGLPIRTRPVSLVGRYSRWLAREPKLAWITTIAAVLLVVTAITATWSAASLHSAWRQEQQLVRAERKSRATAEQAKNRESIARTNAEAARAEATQRESEARRLAAKNRKAADFLATLFTPVDLIGADDGPTAVEPLRPLSEPNIRSAARQVEALLADDPIVAARVKGMLANAARSSGHFGTADTLLSDVATLHERAHGRVPLPDLATHALHHAYLDHARGRWKQAEARYHEALGRQEAVVQRNQNDRMQSLRLAQAEFGLGCLLLRQKKNTAAKPLLERALKTRRELLPAGDALRILSEVVLLQADGGPIDTAKVSRLIAQCDSHLPAEIMGLYWSIIEDRRKKNFASATSEYERLISVIEGTIGKGNAIHILALGDLSGLLRESGDHKRAYAFARRAINESSELDPGHPQRIKAMMTLSFELQLAERFDEARQLLDEVNQYCPEGGKQNDSFNLGLAWCHLHDGTPEVGVKHSAKPLQSIGRVTAAQTAWFCYTHARLLEAAGRTAEARGYDEQAIHTVGSMIRLKRFPKHSTWLKRAALILTHHHRDRDAEPLYRDAVTCGVGEYFNDHPRVAGLKYRLAECLERQGKVTEAALLARQAFQVQTQRLPDDDRRTAKTRVLLERLVPNLRLESLNPAGDQAAK